MKEAYDNLQREFTDDRQWLRYVAAAYQATDDYDEHRDRRKKAAELVKIGPAQLKVMIF